MPQGTALKGFKKCKMSEYLIFLIRADVEGQEYNFKYGFKYGSLHFIDFNWVFNICLNISVTRQET